MTAADDVNTVDPEAVSLTEAMLGYDILVDGEYAGAIEGVPGELEYLTVELHWEDKGVARAALNEFIELSRTDGFSEVSTNNATHPAMEHILETEGFEKRTGEIGWVKEL
jgi:GNAT superfamily N-acetyltransferase